MIHTVGPVWHGGRHGVLAGCYRNSLKLAADKGLGSVAFPCISTGVYRFPLERAARIAVSKTRKILRSDPSIREVVFVCFSPEVRETYARLLAE